MFKNAEELKNHSTPLLKPIQSLGLNPYKKVELWKNYRPVVPIEYHDDEMYEKPDADVTAKVKEERLYRAETRAVLKMKKYGGVKDSIEQLAFGVIGGDS